MRSYAVNQAIWLSKKHALLGVLFCIAVGCCFPLLGWAMAYEGLSPVQKGQWDTLNHYVAENGRITTDIANESFFLHPEGQINPAAEYAAFLDAMKQQEKRVCDFPARLILMREVAPKLLQHISCPMYEKESQVKEIATVSLVFASGYFDSPSSYYGHLLLKFNYKDAVQNAKTLDNSLNYGAHVTDAEGSPLYILKGLTGQYLATYKRNNHFLHSHTYTNKQIRDVWEYKLALTPQQVEMVVAQAWEMKRAQFSYYFFNDNCAHRIVNLVERATGKTLSTTHGAWLLPIQTVEQLYQNGLVEEELYMPSLKTQAEKRFHMLTASQKQALRQFLEDDVYHTHATAQNLAPEVLLVALERVDVELALLSIQREKPEMLEKLNGIRQHILTALLQKPEAEVAHLPIKVPETLQNRRETSLIQLGGGVKGRHERATLRYQIAHNDLLSKPLPAQGPSRFIMGAAEIHAGQGGVKLKELTALDIANINTSTLTVDLGETWWQQAFRKLSWGFSVGYGARNGLCSQCETFSIAGKLGKARKIGNATTLYALAGGRFHHKRTRLHDYATMELESGLVHQQKTARFQVGADMVLDPIQGNPEYTTHATWAQDISQNQELRFKLENDGKNTSITAKIGFYLN